MVPSPNLIHHNQLLNALVLDRLSTEDLGRVEVVWLYPQAHRVLGFICKPGTLSSQRLAFNLPQIHSLNLTGSPKTLWVNSAPTQTDPDRVRQLETLVGHEVWTESGTALGHISDCTFDLKTGYIEHYGVTLKGLRGVMADLFPLPPQDILSFGSKRVLVLPRVAESMAQHQGRVLQTLGELKQEYRQVRAELRSMTTQAQTLLQKTGQRFQSIRQKASTKAQDWTQKTQAQTQDWRDNLQGQAGDWWDSNHDRAEDWLETAQGQGETWINQGKAQVQAQTTELRDKAQESWEDLNLEPQGWAKSVASTVGHRVTDVASTVAGTVASTVAGTVANTVDRLSKPRPPATATPEPQPETAAPGDRENPPTPTPTPDPSPNPTASTPETWDWDDVERDLGGNLGGNLGDNEGLMAQGRHRQTRDRVIYPPGITDDFQDDLQDNLQDDDLQDALEDDDGHPSPWLAGATVPLNPSPQAATPTPEAEVWDLWATESSPIAPDSAPNPDPADPDPNPVPRSPQTFTPPLPNPNTLDLDADPWL